MEFTKHQLKELIKEESDLNTDIGTVSAIRTILASGASGESKVKQINELYAATTYGQSAKNRHWQSH